MKSRFSLALLVAVGFAGVTACMPSEDDEEDVSEDEAELKALELKCKSGATTFDLKAGKQGTFDTGATKTTFTCASPKADAGALGVVAKCSEKPQKVHAGVWEAAITKTGATYKATIKRGKAGDLTLACNAPAPAADAGPPPAAGGGAVPTYAEEAPVIASTCGGCHGTTFDSIDQLKKRKKQMIDALSTGRMPKNKPSWGSSADGKKLIDFLKNSKELL